MCFDLRSDDVYKKNLVSLFGKIETDYYLQIKNEYFLSLTFPNIEIRFHL